MDRTQLQQRLQAGLIHLAASALVATVVTALIFLIWYPPPLAAAQGVSRLLLVLIGVDVALGPLTTTIIFDRGKKSLKFDLSVVVLLQLAALLYGLASIYGGRPALIVFNQDRFDAVPASMMDPGSLELAKQQGKPGLPWLRPRVVAALIPTDADELRALMLSSSMGGADLPELAQYHVSYAEAAAAVIRKCRPLSELRSVNPMEETEWQAVLDSLPLPEAEMAYLPLKAKVKDGAVIVNRQTAEVIRILDLQPRWSR